MNKLSKAGAIAGALLLLVPASALGSTASKSGNAITVKAGGGERNSILVRFDAIAGQYVITDSAQVTANAPCIQVNPTTVTCPDGTVTVLSVDAGNKNDRVTLDAASIPATLISVLRGGQGRDSLTGANSRDTLIGDQHNDTMNGRNGADTYSGGKGFDTVSYATNPVGLRVTIGRGIGDDGNLFDATGLARDTVGHDVESVFGTVGDDVLIGDGSGEFLHGLAGNDRVFGKRGADKVVGGPGDDKVVGGGGPDKVIGKAGVDILKGKKGIDRLKARDGIRDRKINCGKGKNRLEFAKRDKKDPKAKSC